jgi:hypothetical protein
VFYFTPPISMAMFGASGGKINLIFFVFSATDKDGWSHRH